MKGKLLKIQMELKAPKNQKNTFGNYKYRSCEDILEELKPLCSKNKCVLKIEDDLVNIGERYYIKATAILYDTETDTSIEATAFARESETKKGMDESQITGATSSYARKYALNGLFCIDDTKDADTNEYAKKTQEPKNLDTDDYGIVTVIPKINDTKITALTESIKNAKITDEQLEKVLRKYDYAELKDIELPNYTKIVNDLAKLKGE